MELRIAVVQQNANPGQPDENRKKALASASLALDRGAEVILFHEELLVGYTPRLHELAEPVDGVTTQAFQRLLQGTESLIILWIDRAGGRPNLYLGPGRRRERRTCELSQDTPVVESRRTEARACVLPAWRPAGDIPV